MVQPGLHLFLQAVEPLAHTCSLKISLVSWGTPILCPNASCIQAGAKLAFLSIWSSHEPCKAIEALQRLFEYAGEILHSWELGHMPYNFRQSVTKPDVEWLSSCNK